MDRLQKAIKPDDWNMQFHCKCAAVFSLNQHDIFAYMTWNLGLSALLPYKLDYGELVKYSFKCPECLCFTEIDPPTLIKQELDKKLIAIYQQKEQKKIDDWNKLQASRNFVSRFLHALWHLS